jgi:hypothetical protein
MRCQYARALLAFIRITRIKLLRSNALAYPLRLTLKFFRASLIFASKPLQGKLLPYTRLPFEKKVTNALAYLASSFETFSDCSILAGKARSTTR